MNISRLLIVLCVTLSASVVSPVSGFAQDLREQSYECSGIDRFKNHRARVSLVDTTLGLPVVTIESFRGQELGWSRKGLVIQEGKSFTLGYRVYVYLNRDGSLQGVTKLHYSTETSSLTEDYTDCRVI